MHKTVLLYNLNKIITLVFPPLFFFKVCEFQEHEYDGYANCCDGRQNSVIYLEILVVESQ
jgi:hypothetical protein